jgi:3-oxoacyl-[acyl-carrier-protein] synthase-3
MNNKAYISGVAYYLPDKLLTNEDINSLHPEWSADKISSKTGIYARHISQENEFASDLGVKAALELFKKNDDYKKKIDYLIFCTQSPDYLIPTTACILQDRLELKNDIGAIDINMGCSGFIYGLSYAKGLINSKQSSNVLLIMAETYSKHINPLDKNNKTIFGDGASAILITSENESNTDSNLHGAIKDFVFYTNGSGFDKLIVKTSGMRFHNLETSNNFDEEGNYLSNEENLYMDGRAIFEFTTYNVPTIINNVLIKNNITLEEIDLFIFHQANEFMMQFIRKRCHIPEDKFFVFIKNCANTVSSTIPIALNAAIEQNRIKKGNKVLLIGFGVGLSIAATIIEY